MSEAPLVEAPLSDMTIVAREVFADLKSNVVGWRKMHPSANRSFRGRWGRFFKILRR